MKKYVLFVTLVLGLTWSPLKSQSDSLTLSNENIEVVKRYSAKVKQAVRKDIPIDIIEKEYPPIIYQYNISSEKSIDVDPPEPNIQVLSYQGQKQSSEDKKDGYIYGGYGNFNTLNAGAAYHYYIEDWISGGLRLGHFSAKDSLELGKSHYANTDAEIYFNFKLNNKFRFGVDAKSLIQNYNVYDFSKEENVILPVNRFGGGVNGEFNVFESKGFVVRGLAHYLNATHRQDTSAYDNIGDFEISFFKDSDNFSIELPLHLTLGAGSLPNDEANYRDFSIVPNVLFEGTNYKAQLGINIVNTKDETVYFPQISLSLPGLVTDIDFLLYTDFDYRRNSFHEINLINPFFDSHSADYSLWSRKTFGLKASYEIQSILFQLDLKYNRLAGDLNFLYKPDDQRFVASYLDRDEIELNPRITYTVNQSAGFYADLAYKIFVGTDETLYYNPQLLFSIGGQQSFLKNKLTAKETLTYRSPFNTSNFLDSITPDGIVDLGLEVDYKVTPSLKIFAKGVNLFGADYFVWDKQPVFQTQIWGGIKLII